MSSRGRRKVPQISDVISDVPADQVTPAFLTLLEIYQELEEKKQELLEEIARLKGQKPRRKIKPSKLQGGKETHQKES